MQVTKLERSGYMLEYPNFILVFNYTRDQEHHLDKALKSNPDKAVVFFVTHNHRNTFDTNIFNIAQNHKRAFVLSNDIPSREISDKEPVAWMSGGDFIENIAEEGINVETFKTGGKGVGFFVSTPDSTVFYGGALGENTDRSQSDVLIQRIASEHQKVALAMVNESVADSFAAKIATTKLLTYE